MSNTKFTVYKDLSSITIPVIARGHRCLDIFISVGEDEFEPVVPTGDSHTRYFLTQDNQEKMEVFWDQDANEWLSHDPCSIYDYDCF